MKIRVYLLKLLRMPRSVYVILLDFVFVPLWLKANGVDFLSSCRFWGSPIVKMAPSTKISLGKGVKIYSRSDANPCGLPHPAILACLSSGSRIEVGDNTAISGASIVSRCSITIGRNVLIGAGACIWDTDFHPLDCASRLRHPTREAKCAPIKIEDYVFIGARAIILKGVQIGKGAVVGAGAVVSRDIKAGEIVAGNPARPIGSVGL